MATKARSRLADWAGYVALRIVGCVVLALPPDLARWFAEVMADAVFRFGRRYREVTVENLRQAFPEITDVQDRLTLARETYRHFTVMFLEMALLRRKITRSNWQKYVDLSAMAPINAIIAEGRPVILMTAHFGNWELAAHTVGLSGIRSLIVARAIDNPHIDLVIRQNRELTGHKILAKNGEVRKMLSQLKARGTLCLLGDQDAGRIGFFVDFFGRPASTLKAIAHLAQRTDAVIAVLGAERTGAMLEYTMHVMDIIEPGEYAGQADGDLKITQRFTKAIENLVRKAPGQYFWLHRRWKHQVPETMLAKKAA